MNLKPLAGSGSEDSFGNVRPATGLLTLLFTDMVGSTALKQALGDQGSASLFRRHHQLVRETLARFPTGHEIETAGDSFLMAFATPSDSVRFALLLQSRLRQWREECGSRVDDRIGIHLGEVLLPSLDGPVRARELYGIQIDICARVMSLAKAGQVLMSRGVFDSARQVLKGEDVEGGGQLHWLNHGLYRLKGLDEPVEICEVREASLESLGPPTSSEKAQRQVRADEEQVLGWRPAVGQLAPNTQWLLERKLGEGGFGEVWLGRHQAMKERRVFKFCFRADRVRSLKREMTLFRLIKERIGEHPNIVALREVYFEQPPFYVEEEYVEGPDLKAWIEQQGGAAGIALEVKLEIVAQVADGLQAAHDAGVIHRDVKPANILISTFKCASPNDQLAAGEERLKAETCDRKSLRAKLTDFGIGQVVSQEYLAGVTRAGFTMTMLGSESSSQTGTQLYMAPELLAGKPASIRSDIYSLGVVLYQLVVGDLSRPVTTDWADNVTDPLIREDLEHCFAGCPERRYPGAVQLAGQLRRYAERKIESDRRAAELQALQDRAYRRGLLRMGLAAAGIVILIALLGLVALNQAKEARVQKLRAETEADVARRNLYAADMNLAQQALAANNLGRARELLNAHRPAAGGVDLRGWEWRYLWSASRSDESDTLSVETNSIVWLAASPNGRWLAVRLFSATGLDLWDLHTRAKVIHLAPRGVAAQAAFSPNSQYLAFAASDPALPLDKGAFLELWDLEASRSVINRPLPGFCSGLTFSKNGAILLTGTVFEESGHITLWEMPLGRIVESHPVHQSPIVPGHALDMTADARLAVVRSTETEISVIDLRSSAPLWSATASTDNCFLSARFSPDGQVLATTSGYSETCIRLWEAGTGRPLGLLEGHRAFIADCAFQPDGRTLISASADQTLRIWDIDSRQSVRVLRGHQLEVWTLAVLPGDMALASGSKDGVIKLWNKRQLQEQPRSDIVLTNVPGDWFFAHDGHGLLMRDGDTLVRRLGPAYTRSECVSAPGELGGGRLRPSHDCRLVAAGSTNGTVRVWDLAAAKLLCGFQTSTGLAGAVGFIKGGKGLLVYQAATRSVEEWEIPSDQHVRAWITEVPPHDGDLSAHFNVSSDGNWLEVHTERVWVWPSQMLARESTTVPLDLRTILNSTPLPAERAKSAQFSPDGTCVAAASEQGYGRIWPLQDLKRPTTFGGFLLGVHSVAFSPDCKRLALGSNGRQAVKLWDLGSGREVLTLQAEGAMFYRTRISPDGAILGAQNTSGTLYLWPVPSWEEIAQAEAARNGVENKLPSGMRRF